MTRGLRNNNPLNIRRSSSNWLGLKPVVRDKQFCEFKSMAYGFRAAFRNLSHYLFAGYYTPQRIISRWAPYADGNDSNAYLSLVVKKMAKAGVECIPDAAVPALSWDNERWWCLFVLAMAEIENGCDCSHLYRDAEEGFELSL